MTNRLFRVLTIVALIAAGRAAMADPLPGRDKLKFSQLPEDNLTISGQTYWGHDEVSTAYAPLGVAPTIYRGNFMADDFADSLSTPVVHVKWWGSYLNHTDTFGHISKFLIAFEQDVPNPNPLGFSYPDSSASIHSQIVTAGPLSVQSGTFTEKLKSGGGLPLNESLYEYNAELAIPYPQLKDTVQWIKIVALVDQTPGAPSPLWGWHNRDFTQKDLNASPAVLPGENLQGNAATGPIWHFQDDAVSGLVDVATTINSAGLQVVAGINQPLTSFAPTNYVNGVDGPTSIGTFSKDLAFELYTVPEPATGGLMCLALAAIAFRRKRVSVI